MSSRFKQPVSWRLFLLRSNTDTLVDKLRILIPGADPTMMHTELLILGNIVVRVDLKSAYTRDSKGPQHVAYEHSYQCEFCSKNSPHVCKMPS